MGNNESKIVCSNSSHLLIYLFFHKVILIKFLRTCILQKLSNTYT